MQVNIEFSKNNFKKYDLNKIKERLKDVSKPLGDFEKYYRGLIKTNFYRSGEIFGKWPPLSEKYLKRKKKMVAKGEIMGNGLKAKRLEILRLTDDLRKKTFDDNNVKIDNNSIIYKVNTIYANTHQYGRGNIPARPFLFTNAEKGLRQVDKDLLIKIIAKYLIQDFKNEG